MTKMHMFFESAFRFVLFNESGGKDDRLHTVTHDKNDRGGITKYGISLRFLKSIPVERLKSYGVFVHDGVNDDEIVNLKFDSAREIYYGEFWEHAPFEKINVDSIRNYIFDAAVNMGIAPAVKCAQRACWAIHGSRHVLVDDGIMGPDTLSFINRSGTDLLFALRSERGGYYRLIADKNDSQKDFIEGWLNRAYRG